LEKAPKDSSDGGKTARGQKSGKKAQEPTDGNDQIFKTGDGDTVVDEDSDQTKWW
jgi:hypothetical protein